ncbi:MAG: hypothetical protein HY537_02925 [Deltaproteobacteria bacterium]|nr:hypothetical protein [Deltaproteobacteria bacterium]
MSLKLMLFVSLSICRADVADFVDLQKYDFSIKMELAGDKARCLLRKGVAQALSRVQSTLQLQGVGLRVLVCYRPPSVQAKAFDQEASHTTGAAVDVTLLDVKDLRSTKKKRIRLEKAMKAEGFIPIRRVPFHFEYKDKYPSEEIDVEKFP